MLGIVCICVWRGSVFVDPFCIEGCGSCSSKFEVERKVVNAGSFFLNTYDLGLIYGFVVW
jgi:hypothetical protein